MTFESTRLSRDKFSQRSLQQRNDPVLLENPDGSLRVAIDSGSTREDASNGINNLRGRKEVLGGEEQLSLTPSLLTTNGRQSYSRASARNYSERGTLPGQSYSSGTSIRDDVIEDLRVPPRGGSPRSAYPSSNVGNDRDWTKRTPIALDPEDDRTFPDSLPPGGVKTFFVDGDKSFENDAGTSKRSSKFDNGADPDERDFGDGEEDRSESRIEDGRMKDDLNVTYDEDHPTILRKPLGQHFFASDPLPRDNISSSFRFSSSNQLDESSNQGEQLRLALSGITSYERSPRSPVSPGGGFTPSDTPMSPGQRLSPHEPIWMRHQSTSPGGQRDRPLSSCSSTIRSGPVSPNHPSSSASSADKRKKNDSSSVNHTGGRSTGVGSSATPAAGANQPDRPGPVGTVWQQRLQGAFNSLANKFSPKTPRGSDINSNVPMKPQDQKIIALMIAKKEEEARERASRELLQHQWEAERNKEQSRLGRGMPHRRSASQMELNARKDKRASVGGGGVAYSGTPGSGASGSGGTPTRRLEDEDGGMVETQALKRQLTSTKSSKPAKEETNHWPAKERQQSAANEKRKSVEQRLEQQRREMEEHRQQMKEKQEQDLQRANSLRMSREQQQALRAKLKQVQSQQKMEKINQMKQQSMLELNNLQEAIETKMTLAEQKLQRKRELAGRRQRDDLQRRIEQSRMRQQQAEAELKNWQQELLQFKEWQGKHADAIAREALLKKKEAACNERLQKEKLQRDNMKRLLEQEDQWLADVEASIVSKDARSTLINKDKEDFIQRSRAMASNSQRMREELRSHYSTTDLDQWQFHAAQESRHIPKSQLGSMTSLNPVQH